VGGHVTTFEINWSGGKCLQERHSSRESAAANLTSPAGTVTTLIESYHFENDVFRLVFGRGGSCDYTLGRLVEWKISSREMAMASIS